MHRASARPLLVALGLLAPLALGTCELPDFGAPDPASEQGGHTLGLWQGTFVAAVAVGLVVWGLILFVVIRYRRRSDAIPSQKPHNVRMEVLYTLAPIAIVAVLFAFTVRTERQVSDVSAEPDLVVEVVGFQWQWQFTYPDQGIVVTGDNAVGPPELVLPVGATVRLQLVSHDVAHSFWVPDFLHKRDLIPGVDNAIDVDVIRPGTYAGRCAEFCGLDHYRMDFTVRAVSQEEFEAWVAEQ